LGSTSILGEIAGVGTHQSKSKKGLNNSFPERNVSAIMAGIYKTDTNGITLSGNAV